MNPGGLYGEARPENFPNVNAYRNPVIAEAMKYMKYVNMFNRGIGSVQENLKKNGSDKAVFMVDKLTVFEVSIEDANVTDLRRYGKSGECELESNLNEVSSELRQNSDKLATIDLSKLNDNIKALILRLQRQILSVSEIQDLSELEQNLTKLGQNLDRILSKLANTSGKTIVRNFINPAMEQGLVTREHPESPRHPRQRYLLTDKGLEILNLLMGMN